MDNTFLWEKAFDELLPQARQSGAVCLYSTHTEAAVSILFCREPHKNPSKLLPALFLPLFAALALNGGKKCRPVKPPLSGEMVGEAREGERGQNNEIGQRLE